MKIIIIIIITLALDGLFHVFLYSMFEGGGSCISNLKFKIGRGRVTDHECDQCRDVSWTYLMKCDT